MEEHLHTFVKYLLVSSLIEIPKKQIDICLLPAAVDVIDLVVLVEGYGLQAVSQWAVQNPDT